MPSPKTHLDRVSDVDPAPPVITVVAAAIVTDRRLLIVSKKAAPAVFYLPGGKPEEGESDMQALARELGEELGIAPVRTEPLGLVEDVAALEGLPMRMTVFSADIDGIPEPAAELAALGWTDGCDDYAPLLAPAVRNHVIPMLQRTGRLPA
ncbi:MULTISPECIES: NUDIX hydrolase [Streptomyces]|uniref:NUDIX hydrolase n=1 Tax=Streptomyces TaxID=1883 RepID=UPI000CF2EAEC|nr:MULTISPECIES: NUDIX domain-containing protein [Streptomyces]PPS70181.1 hypothetical protein BV882_25685 [Streptomyces sp. 46]